MSEISTNVVPLAHPIKTIPKVTGCSLSAIYRAIRAGELTARKRGRSTLVEDPELKRWISTWPTIGRRPEQVAA